MDSAGAWKQVNGTFRNSESKFESSQADVSRNDVDEITEFFHQHQCTASILPSHRRQGWQRAMIRERIARAKEAGMRFARATWEWRS